MIFHTTRSIARFIYSGFFFLLFFLPNTADAQLALLDKKQSTTCVDREFTVMVHMVRDTFQNVGTTVENIEIAMEVLNTWFEPICVRFEVASIDTIDNFQYSVPANLNELEQLWTNHNAENRINLYIVRDLTRVSPEPVYATDEGILQLERGGVLINRNEFNDFPVWLVHAFGHYCGLLDTNTDFPNQIVTDPNCDATGDQLCDTPADPLDPSAPFGGLGIYFDETCRFIYTPVDANGEYFLTQTGNAMSRYPSFCWCGLTYEQFERMAGVIAQSPLW